MVEYMCVSYPYYDDVYDGWSASLSKRQSSYSELVDSYLKALSTKPKSLLPEIKNVIFNAPATIVYWSDRTKTVVKADCEDYNPEKGLAMAIAKKALGNEGNYYEVFKKWVGEDVLFSLRDDQKAQD